MQNHEEWMKQVEEDRKRYAREKDEADKQTTRWIKWFWKPLIALMIVGLFIEFYVLAPTIIQGLIDATARWHALFQ